MAILKIITGDGNYRDPQAYQDVIHCCLSAEKTPSRLVNSPNLNLYRAVEQMEDTAEAFHQNKGTRLRHFVLCFDDRENITLEKAQKIAIRAMRHYQSDYQILSAVHENTDHIHIHFVMNRISYLDGSRYQGKKRDFHQFQNHLRRIMAPYNIKKLIVITEVKESDID